MGIDAASARRFVERLHKLELPMHSVILMHQDEIIYEAYQKPYGPDSLHRMYSITKSLVSLAVGCLEAEGKLSLSDHIVDYFPEKCPKDVHPYIAAMTIEDMLTMRTCHHKTTYKLAGCEDWVESFFTTEPSHYPGTFFAYDTSSAHVMGALVEKLTGMELLDYLRAKALDEIGFSKEAYCLKDPMGITIGGSGLMAKPSDILKVVKLIADSGVHNGRQLLPKNYLERALTMASDNYVFSQSFEEMQGYGYQIWKTSHDGFVLYGMGGQLGLWIPKDKLILVTTGDVQGRKEGMQAIYQAFWEEIYNLHSDGMQDEKDTQTLHSDRMQNESKIQDAQGTSVQNQHQPEEIMQVFLADKLDVSQTCQSEIDGVTFTMDVNGKPEGINTDHVKKSGFDNMKLKFGETEGVFSYTYDGQQYELAFGRGGNIETTFPKYGHRTLVSGAWQNANTFVIYSQIIDEYIGKVFLNFSFNGDHVGIMFRKIEESYYKEFDLYGSGTLQRD